MQISFSPFDQKFTLTLGLKQTKQETSTNDLCAKYALLQYLHKKFVPDNKRR